jgi:hypothetical protein
MAPCGTSCRQNLCDIGFEVAVVVVNEQALGTKL